MKFAVEAAPEWTGLFNRKSGWFGADGIFSFSLDGDEQPRNDPNREVMLIFSDTFIGEVEEGKPAEGYKMVNNSVAYLTGQSPHPDSIHFFYKQDEEGQPQTFFVPHNENAREGQYYWLGDGFVNKEKDNTLYLFAYHIEMTGPNVFDFIEPNVSLLAIPAGSRPPFEGQRQLTTPLHVKNERLGEGNMGAGILVNTNWAGAPHPDGYVYVYGCIGQDKNLIAARVKPKDFENFNRWRYWNGEKWVRDENEMKPVTNAVSNELSVTPLADGRYLLVFQVLGISEKVGLRVGESPVGPFGPIQEIWRTPEIDEGLLPYNAKAHPCLSKPGELLISYNTITFDFWNDIQKDAHIYRPRFIRLKWE
ncbi:MAG: DUF4185 domain-containing protein [Phaeodactylibacter sp.]|nr:DUF4185 domain-containing protein [Phaeodactylibacter sp.]MCB9267264.1 DUF4185 domain-containing protein [Lewinellaceae bacterium]MCB9285675.1 DUF4185 domain-containing protein [Lewinellaceae bacterium]